MAVPIYQRIYEDLRYKICSGVLSPGDELPIDAELEKIYGASRAPVRQALENLSAEGLIVRGAGRRTSVAEKVNIYQWLPGTGFRKYFESEWSHMVCRTFAADMVDPPEEARVFLRRSEGEKVVHLLRVRYFYGEPKMLTHSYLPPQYSLELLKGLGDIAGLREVLFQYYGRSVSHIKDSLAVRRMLPEEAELLDVPASEPQLQIFHYVYDEDDKPMFFNLRYARTDSWRFEVDFRRRGGFADSSF